MQEELTGLLTTTDVLFIVAAIASIIGIGIYYLYGGFLTQNYKKIKWFRRLFLPHVSKIIKDYDESNEDVDLSQLSKTETTTLDSEHVFDLHLKEHYTKETANKLIGNELIENHFRPEVILASVGRQETSEELELGNFVLTAPEKNHPDTTALGRLYDIVLLFTSKYQLHVRYFYDEEKHRIRFYAHYELNPYNPLYAKKHLEAEKFNVEKGVEMFKKYKDNIKQYGVEIV